MCGLLYTRFMLTYGRKANKKDFRMSHNRIQTVALTSIAVGVLLFLPVYTFSISAASQFQQLNTMHTVINKEAK